jgi:hypothetical protein
MTRALVGDRRIGEAIRYNDFALAESRQHRLFDVLRPGREHEQQLGYWPELAIRGIEQDAPDLLAGGRSAGFDGLEHRVAFMPETLGE